MASSDKIEWEVSVDQEHDQMLKTDVWEVVEGNKVTPAADIIDSRWAMKKKVNGD